jgi:hypothetical protein
LAAGASAPPLATEGFRLTFDDVVFAVDDFEVEVEWESSSSFKLFGNFTKPDARRKSSQILTDAATCLVTSPALTDTSPNASSFLAFTA